MGGKTLENVDLGRLQACCKARDWMRQRNGIQMESLQSAAHWGHWDPDGVSPVSGSLGSFPNTLKADC